MHSKETDHKISLSSGASTAIWNFVARFTTMILAVEALIVCTPALSPESTFDIPEALEQARPLVAVTISDSD